jgi:hypothetical protein
MLLEDMARHEYSISQCNRDTLLHERPYPNVQKEHADGLLQNRLEADGNRAADAKTWEGKEHENLTRG